MTLFSLIWAAFLPHHPGLVAASPARVLLAANPYAAASLHRQDTTALSAYSYSPLHGQSPRYRPIDLRPQLLWPTAAAVDWSRWSATAVVTVVVTVVDKAHATYKTNGATQLNLPAPVCGGLATSAPGEAGPHPGGFTIQVKNVAIGQVTSHSAAEQVAEQIRRALPSLEANPGGLTPSLGKTLAAGQVGGQTVFSLPGTDAADHQQTALQATQWVNNLRLAFGADPLELSQVQMVAYGLGETHQSFDGTASWYGPYFHGRKTATGETFNQHDLTAAHKTLPFGTYLKVSNQLNGKSVVVRINDRGPYVGDRSLDLSYAAAQCLGSDYRGVVPYQATVLAPGIPQDWRAEVLAAQRP